MSSLVTENAAPIDIDSKPKPLVKEKATAYSNWRILEPMEQEFVILCTGPRGSNKSLMASILGIGEMAADIPFWSNLPIDTGNRFTDLPRLQSKELDLIKLYSMGKDLEEGATYLLDEFDKICASRWSAASNINRVLDWLGTQIRKFGTSFILTAQNYWHIDPIWRDQIDIVIFCKDLSHSPWGKSKHLQRGELGYIDVYDKSGFKTGFENDPYVNRGATAYTHCYVQGKPFWGTYDTKKVLGIEAMFRRLKFVKDTVHLGQDGMYGEGGEGGTADLSSLSETNQGDGKIKYIEKLVHDIRAKQPSRTDISLAELTHLVKTAGMNIDANHLGRMLSRLNIPSLGLKRMEYGGVKQRSILYDIGGIEATSSVQEEEQGFSPVPDDVKDTWLGKERGQRGGKQGAQIFPD